MNIERERVLASIRYIVDCMNDNGEVTIDDELRMSVAVTYIEQADAQAEMEDFINNKKRKIQ